MRLIEIAFRSAAVLLTAVLLEPLAVALQLAWCRLQLAVLKKQRERLLKRTRKKRSVGENGYQRQ